jgi:hypothetical protein
MAYLQDGTEVEVVERISSGGKLYDAAMKYGLQVPDGLREFVASQELTAATKTLEDARSKVAEAEKALADTQDKWGTK